MTPNIPAFVVTEDKSLIRDTKNGALLQTDRTALDRHRASLAKSKSLVSRVTALERELLDLRQIVATLAKGN
jgi:hypothetical protein